MSKAWFPLIAPIDPMAPIARNSVQVCRRSDRAEFYLGDHDRPGRPDRPSTFRHCFHIIAWIVCTLFRAIGATRAIGAIIWKPGFMVHLVAASTVNYRYRLFFQVKNFELS